MLSVPHTLQLAKKHHQAGNVQAAEQLYDQVLQAEPGHAEAHYLLGLLDRQRGRDDQAVQRFSRAAEIEPKNPVFHYALGNALAARGDHEQAAARLRRAIRLHPQFAEAHSNLGLALGNLDRLADAMRSYREALKINPRFVPALVNLGNAHRSRGELAEAAECFSRAIELEPNTAQAHNNLGNVLLAMGKVEPAIEHFTAALDVDPRYAEAHNNLGTAHQARDDYAAAVRSFHRALELSPDDPPILLNLGNALLGDGRTAEAIDAFERAVELDPGLVAARWSARLALPILYDDQSQIEHWRKHYESGLERLIEQTPLRTRRDCQAAAAGVGMLTPFHLAYQARDDRPLQERYGRFAHEIMTGAYPKFAGPRRAPPRGDGRIRVGWLSSYLRFHAVGRLMLGFLQHADRERFETFAYHTGAVTDEVTDQYREACSTFRRPRPDVQSVCRQVADDRLHVLIYPDIGMSPFTTQLAALHLAPVQCMAWGHPVTSGLPSIGWFISSQAMEPAGAEAHYAEELVELPGVGVSYERPQMPAEPLSRAELGLPDDGVLLLCCQSLYKYLPQYDGLYVEIARQAPTARLVFLASRSDRVTADFRGRITRAFDEAGLDAGRHVTLLPRLDPHRGYLSLHLAADVYLDTPGWSGGNTTFEAVAAGLPVVTLPGQFMRGRHACGILQTMGLTDTIAADEAQYVQIAVSLATDGDFRGRVRAQLAERADRVFDDQAPVRALEAFLERTVAEAAS